MVTRRRQQGETPLSSPELADILRERIHAGQYAPGAVMPSAAEIAEEFAVKPSLARYAMERLDREGLTTTDSTRPRIVRDRRPLEHYASRSESMEHREGAQADAWMTDVEAQGFKPDYLRPQHTVEIVKADGNVARLLGLSPGDLVVVRRRVRTVDGRPDNLNDTYYDFRLVADKFPEVLSTDDVPQGIVALMAERGYRQVLYRDELRWRPPTPDEAKQLGLPPRGSAVLVQMRTGYTDTAGRQPVKITVTVWPGDTHVMIYELPGTYEEPQ